MPNLKKSSYWRLKMRYWKALARIRDMNRNESERLQKARQMGYFGRLWLAIINKKT